MNFYSDYEKIKLLTVAIDTVITDKLLKHVDLLYFVLSREYLKLTEKFDENYNNKIFYSKGNKTQVITKSFSFNFNLVEIEDVNKNNLKYVDFDDLYKE